MGDTVLYEAADAVATLTLNRPERLNAITPRARRRLRRGAGPGLDDDEVRVIRLRGAGRSFCAGYDIGWGVGDRWRPPRLQRRGTRSRTTGSCRRFVDTYMALWRSPKPVIAQVHGYCVGGGTDFALCSDLIVCAEDCRIGYPPARVWGSPTTAMWMYRLGLERSKRLLLTGDALDGAPRGASGGWPPRRCPRTSSTGAGLALARRVALLPANQLQMMKLLVNQAFEQMGLHTTQLDRHAARRRGAPHARGHGLHPARRWSTSAAPWPTATPRSATTGRGPRRCRR